MGYRYRLWSMRGGALLLSSAIAIAGSEAALRLWRPQLFPPHPPGMYLSDEDVGFVLAPGFEGLLEHRDYTVRVATNANGLRGEAVRAHDPETLRVLCIGDSFTWGAGVEAGETFVAVLQRRLVERFPGRDLQVLNGGVPGYGTDEALVWLEKFGPELEPDVVVAQFFPGNDFGDNRHPATETIRIRDGLLVGDAALLRPFRPGWLRALTRSSQRSHLLTLARVVVAGLGVRAAVLPDLIRSPAKYFTEEDEVRAVDLLERIAAVSRSLGARPVFLFAPDKAQMLSRPTPPLRASRVVVAAAASSKAAFVEPTRAFLAAPNFESLYFPTDGHWTPAGHALVAELLEEAVSRELGLGR